MIFANINFITLHLNITNLRCNEFYQINRSRKYKPERSSTITCLIFSSLYSSAICNKFTQCCITKELKIKYAFNLRVLFWLTFLLGFVCFFFCSFIWLYCYTKIRNMLLYYYAPSFWAIYARVCMLHSACLSSSPSHQKKHSSSDVKLKELYISRLSRYHSNIILYSYLSL